MKCANCEESNQKEYIWLTRRGVKNASKEITRLLLTSHAQQLLKKLFQRKSRSAHILNEMFVAKNARKRKKSISRQQIIRYCFQDCFYQPEHVIRTFEETISKKLSSIQLVLELCKSVGQEINTSFFFLLFITYNDNFPKIKTVIFLFFWYFLCSLISLIPFLFCDEQLIILYCSVLLFVVAIVVFFHIYIQNLV